MLAASTLTECLLNLALQRNLAGLQQALQRTFEQFGLSAWAVILPPSSVAGSRPVFMAHGVRGDNSSLLRLASKNGLESVFSSQGIPAQQLNTLAQEITPDARSSYRILRAKREKGGEFILLCYRPAAAAGFSEEEMAMLGNIGRLLDRCFLMLVQAQEQEFEAGLFRLVGNLHPEGLCILDNRLRIVFENRQFKEQMHVWNRGPAALQNLTLPKQSELPADWRDACDRSFQAFQEVKFPPVSGRMVVSQGSLSTLKKPVDTESWIEGAVRYLAFQSALGVRPYLILTCSVHRQQHAATGLNLKRIAENLGFSRRETELADLILQGSSAREIASELKIALPTVKTHIRHILHKSGVKTRLQFVGLCSPRG